MLMISFVFSVAMEQVCQYKSGKILRQSLLCSKNVMWVALFLENKF